MATLEVSFLKNVTATVTNVSLNPDGSTIFAVPSTVPSSPRTGMLWYNGSSVQVYNGSSWVPSSSGSGISSISVTSPLATTGGTSPTLSVNLATAAIAYAGTSNSAVSIPQYTVPKDASGMSGAAILPGGGLGGRPTAPLTGMLRYNNSTLPAVLEYYNGTSWSSVPTTAASGLPAASLAQAQAGTSTAVANTPETSVPKDAAGMSGAALLPGGTDGARPLSPVTGMIRYNNNSGLPATLEYYTGLGWSPVASTGAVSSVTATLPLTSSGGANPNIAATIATAADAAAGTSINALSTPRFSVPKDASGMTGAALLPSGTLGQRPTSGLVSGMTRFRTDASPASLETYTGSAWKQIAYANTPPYVPTLPDLTWDFSDPTFVLPKYTVCRNLTIIDQASAEYKPFGGLEPTGFITPLPNTGSVCTIIAYGDIYVGTRNNFQLLPSAPISLWSTTGSVLNEAGFGAGGAAGGPGNYPGVAQQWSSFGAGTGATGSHGGSLTAARAVSPQGGAGTSLLMVAYGNITFAASAGVSASGGNTYNGSVISYPFATTGSGGGGGAGGNIIIQSFGTLTIDSTVTFDANGGDGAPGLNTVGTGGAYGGGGGGGGWVVLGGRDGYSYTPVTAPDVSGGLAGANTTSPATRGGSGGSNAGVGGFGGTSTVSPSNGSDGVALLDRFLLDVF